MTPGALILCGGQSLRMGRPKAWLPFGPEPLLARVVRLIGQEASPIVVVAAKGQDLPKLPESATIVRDPQSGLGPLQGIAAGLAAFPESVDLVYASATDAPFLQPGWISHLVDLISDHDLAIPSTDDRNHPLAALYRRAKALSVANEHLTKGQLRLASLTDRLRARVILPDELTRIDPNLQTLRNLNTPEEYRQALRDADLVVG